MDAPDRDQPDLMPLGAHLQELRRRLIWALAGLAVGVAAGLLLGRWVLELLARPYRQVMTDRAELFVYDMAGGFLAYLRASLLAGVLLAAPWVFYQAWRFVAAGLTARERRAVLWAAPASAGLFIGGALFFLFVAAEPLLAFFKACNDWLGFAMQIRLQNHLAMMTNLMLVFGLCFQLPLAVWVLARLGVVTPAGLAKYRRHVIVAILILAATLTSPSPVDQLLLAGPMILLYELGVLLARTAGRARKPTA